MTSDGKRHTGLTTLQLYELDRACSPIRRAFGRPPYLVGTAATGTRTYRDVDVRMMLDDADYDALFGDRPHLWALVSMTISVYLRDRTGLPIDFQVQRVTEANEKYGDGQRNPLGIDRTFAGGGDGTPKTR